MERVYIAIGRFVVTYVAMGVVAKATEKTANAITDKIHDRQVKKNFKEYCA